MTLFLWQPVRVCLASIPKPCASGSQRPICPWRPTRQMHASAVWPRNICGKWRASIAVRSRICSAGAALEQDTGSGGAAHFLKVPCCLSGRDARPVFQYAHPGRDPAAAAHRAPLHVLHEHTVGYDQRLQSLEALLSPPLAAWQPFQQAEVGPAAPCPAPAPGLLPVQVRARSRVTALIEYGAQGQYVAVCPRQGVLALVPDSSAWFDWLASLTSFRFLGPAGRFSACRASEKGTAHPPLGGPARVSWPRLLALSGGHGPFNARRVGRGGGRPASSGGRALRT